MHACVRACVRARWCVPKSSWLRWCSRWVGCDSPSLPILLLLSDRLWCQIWLVTDSGSCAVVCQDMPVFFVLFFYFFISSLHHCLIWAFHNLCDPFPALKSFSFFQTTTDKWFIYSQLPVICTHTLQPEGKKKKSGKPLKSKIMTWKVCGSSVFCSKEKHSQMRARTASQRDVSSLASVEWQGAKWAWPSRRGNSITVCQSWGSARDTVAFQKELNG